MKKLLLTVILLTLTIYVFSANMHGVYISTWNEGLLSKKQIDKTIEDAKADKITDIFVQVRRMDDAFYTTKIAHKPTVLKEDFDMLDYVIKKAKPNKIKIHAWFVICRIGMQDYKKTLSPTQISWLNNDKNNNIFNENNVFIDPSNPNARAYIVSIINEVANNYQIDGIHLDYIRYPNNNFGYTKNSLLQYTLETGKLTPIDESYDNFRREQINKLIFEIRNSLNKKRKITLSASITCWGNPTTYTNLSSFNNTFQDYEKWINNNWVDFIMPMIYKREHIEKQSQDFVKWLDLYSNHKNKVIPVIAGYLNTKEGLVTQIKKTENKGFKNWIIYDFNENSARNTVNNALR